MSEPFSTQFSQCGRSTDEDDDDDDEEDEDDEEEDEDDEDDESSDSECSNSCRGGLSKSSPARAREIARISSNAVATIMIVLTLFQKWLL